MQFNRVIFLAVCLKLSTISLVSGQTPRKIDNERVFNAANFPISTLPIEASTEPSASLYQFSKLKVVDVRADSLGVGFKMRVFSTQKRRLLRLEKNITYQLEEYLHKSTRNSPDSSAPILVLFLKDFWITEYDTEEDDNKINNVGLPTGDAIRKTSLTLRADCFVKSGNGYYAAMRFDTTMIESLNMKKFSKGYIDLAFALLLERLQVIDPAAIVSGKTKRAFDEIITHYREERNIPILKDKNLQAGVYQTFEEFKSNKPSVQSFEVKKGKWADVLHANGVPTRNVWGYCDGKYVFIKSGENYYPMVRFHDSFYYLGSTELIRVWRTRGTPGAISNSGNFNPGGYTEVDNVLFPLKLNWQTGKPY
jgi:hypothetical protein